MVNTAALAGLGVIVGVPTVAVAYEYNQYQALVAANGGPYASATGSTGFFAWLTGGMPKTWGSAPTGTSYNWNGTSCVLASGTSGEYPTLAACQGANSTSGTVNVSNLTATQVSGAVVGYDVSVNATATTTVPGATIVSWNVNSGLLSSPTLPIILNYLTTGADTITLTATDSAGNTGSATVNITIVGTPPPPQGTPTIGVSPTSVPTGTSNTLNINGSGFADGSSIQIYAVLNPSGTVVSLGVTSTGVLGNFGNISAFQVLLPYRAGTTSAQIYAVDGSGNTSGKVTVTITGVTTADPQISVSPTSVGAGGSVTISGSGFTPSGVATVFVWFQTTETLVFNINISASGSITQGVPTEAVITGIYSCYVLDNTSGLTSNTVEFSGIGVA